MSNLIFNNNEYNINPVSYTNKDFRAIYEELLDIIGDLTERWDPKVTNESDPGLVLVKLKAFLADKLNYNIDKNTLENFPSQVTQRGNAQKLYDILGYNMKHYQAATTKITMRYNKGNNAGIYNEFYTIPAFTSLTDDSNTINFVTTEDVKIPVISSNQPATKCEIIEGIVNDFIINGDTRITVDDLDADYRLYFIETMVAQNGVFIFNEDNTEDNSEETYWTQVSNLEANESGKKVFKFGVMPNTNTCYIEFPQDAANLFGSGIHIKYIITKGIEGNIGANVLTSIANELINDDIKEQSKGEDGTISKSSTSANLKNYTMIIQPEGAINGEDPESLKQAYRNYKKIANTFNTLVTVQDYQNAIYNLFPKVVSNCVVSDRTNDINYSYKVVNKTTDGDRVLSLNTGSLDEKTKIFTPDMNAFQIGIYALINVDNVTNAKAYDRSFQTNLTTIENAQAAIEEYKSIQHDYIYTVDPFTVKDFIFKNMVSLEGKVLTSRKVSKLEAEEIQKNIKNYLYKTYQARNIDFGQPLEYNELINSIKKADPRIKEVILEYPEYQLCVMKSDNSKENIGLQLDLNNSNDVKTLELTRLQAEIIAKSILSGATPYFIFNNNQILDYSMGPVVKYNKAEYEEKEKGIISTTPAKDDKGNLINLTLEESKIGDSSTGTDGIAAITTSVKILPTNDNEYTLKDNENVFCVGPSYVSKAQLSTCLYYAFLSNDKEKPTISANSYYTLNNNEYLIAAEGLDADGNLDLSGSKQKKFYIYTQGDVIYSTIDITSKQFSDGVLTTGNGYSKIKVTSADNLGTSNQIEILNENKVQINKDNKLIYAIWSVDNLNNQLFDIEEDLSKTSEGKYQLKKLLQNNEFFIYTDENKEDLILLGSGTEISVECDKEDILKNQFKNSRGINWAIDPIDITSVSVDGLSTSVDWNEIPLNLDFFTAEKQIINLGKGTTIKFTGDALSNVPKKIEEFQYKYDGELTFNSLPEITSPDSDKKWEIFSKLSLTLSPTQGQLLKENQAVNLYTATINNAGTISYALKATLGPDQYVTSNYPVVLSGGYQQNTAVLEEDGTFKRTLEIYVSGKGEGISSNQDALKKLFPDSSVAEYPKYTEIVLNTMGGDIESKDYLELSPQFQDTLIPILFTASKEDTALTISIDEEDKSNYKIINNNDDNKLDEIKINGFQNKYLNYIRVVPSDNNDEITKIRLKFKITSNNYDTLVKLTLFNPLKILETNVLLGANLTDKDKTINATNVKDIFDNLNTTNSLGKSLFDYSYQIDEEDQILNPLDPESFFLPNHPFNRWVIPQLKTGEDGNNIPYIDIRVSKQSQQLK